MTGSLTTRLLIAYQLPHEKLRTDYPDRVAAACDGQAGNEELFTLLSDKRVASLIENRLNNGADGSVRAQAVDNFILFLRGKLGEADKGLPDSWVVKSFGFNLFTGERKSGREIPPHIKKNLGRLNLSVIHDFEDFLSSN